MINEQYPLQAAFDVGEYADVLQKQQSYNVAEVSFLQHKVESREDKDAMLKDLMVQPVMVDAYRTAGVKPDMVAGYVDSVLKMKPEDKDDLIRNMYALYGIAGENHDNDVARQVSDKREWLSLKASLVRGSITYPMRDYVKAQNPSNKEPEKKKRMVKLKEGVGRWFGEAIKKVTLSAAAITAVVITSGVADNTKLSPEGQKLIDKELAKDNTKANDANTLKLVAKNTQHQA